MPNNPEDPSAGTRKVPFARELWIERDDFMEDPPRKFFRLAPGREVRLRSAYFVTCREVVKDADGGIVELRCTYDPATRGGDAPDGRRPKATLHWVSAAHAVPAEVRLYDHLFKDPHPGAGGRDLFEDVDPDSETVLGGCVVEPSLAELPVGADRPVRAARLLLPRPRLGARRARLQPDAHAQGHLGEAAGARAAGHGLTASGRRRRPRCLRSARSLVPQAGRAAPDSSRATLEEAAVARYTHVASGHCWRVA